MTTQRMYTYIAAATAVCSAAATFFSNLATLHMSNFTTILLYTLLPMAAALLFAGVLLIPSIRDKQRMLIFPVMLGGIVFACEESYAFLLFSLPDRFTEMWDYLCADVIPLAVVIILVTLGLLASTILFLLRIAGVFRNDLALMAVIGLSVLFCIAEYVVGMLMLTGDGFPWYMLSVLLFLMAELLTVFTFAPSVSAKADTEMA